MSKYNDNGRKWWRKRKAVTIIIDEFWNIPLWRGKNADGVHQCPKGPRAARSWAFVCHVPPEGAKRWRVIPWHGWWAIRFEPIGWECQWMIPELHRTRTEADESIKKF